MSVTDFECAIAKSQIARYISGENLAPEIARQLESHIAACPRCKQLLQEKKSSLEAMILDKGNGSEARTEVSIASEPVPMVQGNLALKPEPKTEPMAYDSEIPHLTLRERIREQARALKPRESTSADVPTVAPAFAYHESPETTQVEIPSSEPMSKKRKGLLSSLALWENVPEGEMKPALKKENIRAAKAAVANNNIGVKKPALYLTGLLVVVGAMSFILKDPTALFGDKVAKKATPQDSTKPAPKVAKLPKGQAKRMNNLMSEGTTNADSFYDPTPKAPTPKKPAPKKPAPKKPTAKTPVKPAAKKPAPKKPAKAAKKTAYRTWGTKAPATKHVAHKAAKSHKHPRQYVRVHKPSSSTPKGNVVKLYAPESSSN